MNKQLKKLTIIVLFCFANKGFCQGYINEKVNLGVSFGYANYHAKALNNKNNNGTQLSYFTAINLGLPIAKKINFNQQIMLGSLQNGTFPEKNWTQTNLFSYNFGFSANLFRLIGVKKEFKLTPFTLFNYQINYALTTTINRPKNVFTALNYGLGIGYNVNSELSCYLQMQHIQRLGADLKTGLNIEIGLKSIIIKPSAIE